MRLLDLPVAVATNPQGRLLAFFWRGRRYTVEERLDLWRETGAWWEGEPEKTFLLVRTAPSGVFELYYIYPGALTGAQTCPVGNRGSWRLYKVYD